MAKFLQHLIDSLQGKKNSCRPNTQFKVQVNGLYEARRRQVTSPKITNIAKYNPVDKAT